MLLTFTMANSLILKRHFNGNFDFTFYFIHVMSVDTTQAQYSHTDFATWCI